MIRYTSGGVPYDDGQPDNTNGMGVTPSGGNPLSQQYAGSGLPEFQNNQDYLNKMLSNQTPFASNQWGDLIKQLQDRASGTAPSLAQQNYRQANMDTQGNIAAMANGSNNPAMAREAMIQQGRVGQGLGQGLVTSGLQEQEQSQGDLTKALGARDNLNQNAVLNLMSQKLGLNKDQFNAVMNRQMMSNQQDAQTAQAAAQTMALIAMLAA